MSSDFSLGNLVKTSYKDFLKLAATSYFYHIKAPGYNYKECQSCSSFAFCVGCFVGPIYAMEKAKREGRILQCMWDKKNNFTSMLNIEKKETLLTSS